MLKMVFTSVAITKPVKPTPLLKHVVLQTVLLKLPTGMNSIISAQLMTFLPAHVKDAVTSTAVMNLTTSCTRLSMMHITLSMTTSLVSTRTGMQNSTPGGTQLNQLEIMNIIYLVSSDYRIIFLISLNILIIHLCLNYSFYFSKY